MTITLKINGEVTYEAEINIQKAGQIIAFLGAGAPPNYAPEGDAAPLTTFSLQAGGNTSGSPRQAISDAQAKTNSQKIAALAKYLKNRGQEVFTRAEILEQFRRAGESTPKNIGRDLKDAVSFGYICESDNQRNEFYLTNDGEAGVVSKFVSLAMSSKNSKPRSKIRKPSLIEPTNPTLKSLEFSPIQEGLPDYWKITKKGDRVLWLLQVCKLQNVKELSTKDIEYVAKQLDDNVPASGVNSLTEASRKSAYLSKRGNTYSILGPGTTYIQSLKNNQ